MQIETFVVGVMNTNCYLVVNEESRRAVVVDPAVCSAQMMEYIQREDLQVEAVLLTHGHFDHIMGIDDLRKKFPVPVYVHQDEREMMNDPVMNFSAGYFGGYSFADAVYIRGGQTLSHAGYDFRVLHTPGHTRGGVCYYVETEKVLFSGDTLFRETVGRTDFPDGSMSDLVRGIQEKLYVLPDDVEVYPGHMEKTTIGHEKRYNLFL